MLARRILLLAIALQTACGGSAVDLPSIQGWTGEPQVAEVIEKARREAIERPTAARIGRLGELFHAHDLFSEALACYELSTELAPEDGRWPYLAALATRKLQLEPSLAFFEQAIERGVEHPGAFLNLADTLAQLDRPEEAIERYRQALALDPSSSHALLGLGRAELTRGDVETARRHLEKARELAPRHGEVRLLLARVYQRQGLAERAEEELLVAGAYPDPIRAPDPLLQGVLARAVNSVALIDRGRRLAAAGRYAEAESHFRQVLAIRPGTAVDHANLGGALARQGKTTEAIGEYRRALEIDPDNAQAHNNLAMALAERGDLEGAIRHLGLALATDPAYAEAHHNLGLLQAGRGHTTAAIAHYREALRHNPSFARAHSDLGAALETQGDREAARRSWHSALAIDPRELAALYNLARSLSRAGDHAAAVEWIERGVEIAPNSSRLIGFLAWELATAPDATVRDGARAAELAGRIFEAYPDQAQTGDVYAAALAEAGRFDHAIEIATRSLQRAGAGNGQPELAREIAGRLALYREGRAFRQESGRSP